MRHRIIVSLTAVFLLVSAVAVAAPDYSVGPQYDSTHVYVAPQDFDPFMASFVATFGGTMSKQGLTRVTPTPSETMFQFALTPAGTISVFGFKTPIPYPFGAERMGYLVSDFDRALAAAQESGADVIVSPYPDPIGRDAVISWPGAVNMQIYWHTTPPNYAPLSTIPENHVYLSTLRAETFVRDFLSFSQGKVLSDDASAPGIEVGRPRETFRRIRINSGYGKMTVFVTDGHLPYPYGREVSGYEVPDLYATLERARQAGVSILVPPYASDQRVAAMVQFPGGYIAEVHAGSRGSR